MNNAIIFTCPAGVRNDGRNLHLWIESPRTHRRVSVHGAYTQELPRRLVCRVVKARSEGRSLVDFTRDELLAVVALANRINGKAN